MEFFNTSG